MSIIQLSLAGSGVLCLALMVTSRATNTAALPRYAGGLTVTTLLLATA